MDAGLLVIGALTFVIHLVGTLAYSVRIAGTRTQRIALTLSLFNLVVLVSRTSNSFQAPLLAKRVEQNIASGVTNDASDFRWLLAFATVATLAGALLIPTLQRLLSRWVEAVSGGRNVLGLGDLLRAGRHSPHRQPSAGSATTNPTTNGRVVARQRARQPRLSRPPSRT